jgi:hypothetical protein
LLLIDHRNYDYILNNCATPAKNIYYNVTIFIIIVISQVVVLINEYDVFRATT